MALLDGKVIIILGASNSQSMGAATARKCIAEGATVVIAARNEAKVK